MKENQSIIDYRELLNIAPFSWSTMGDVFNMERDESITNLFQIPQIVK